MLILKIFCLYSNWILKAVLDMNTYLQVQTVSPYKILGLACLLSMILPVAQRNTITFFP